MSNEYESLPCAKCKWFECVELREVTLGASNHAGLPIGMEAWCYANPVAEEVGSRRLACRLFKWNGKD